MPKCAGQPAPGLRIRKDSLDIWTLVLFDEMTPTVKLQVTYVWSHFAERDMCPNVLPYAEA